MYLGSVYLIVRDFDKSIDFYEKLLDMKVTCKNMDRFAQFIFEGHNISIMNGYFDINNPEKVQKTGRFTEEFDDLAGKAESENTNKFVLNFGVDDLKKEYDRLKEMDIGHKISEIKYINAGSPYYHFHIKDPDDNIIEITGGYYD